MIEARNLGEFIAANSALQMPFFNVIYADQQGQIMYLFGGRQPVRQGGTWSDYAGILPGDDPKAPWTATFPSWALPRAIDPPGGFVANSNNPPWTSTFPEVIDPGRFPSYLAPNFMALRPQNAALFRRSPQGRQPSGNLAGFHTPLQPRQLKPCGIRQDGRSPGR